MYVKVIAKLLVLRYIPYIFFPAADTTSFAPSRPHNWNQSLLHLSAIFSVLVYCIYILYVNLSLHADF